MDINDYILSHLFLQLQNDGVEIINDFYQGFRGLQV